MAVGGGAGAGGGVGEEGNGLKLPSREICGENMGGLPVRLPTLTSTGWGANYLP
jgi:hypothetical protein